MILYDNYNASSCYRVRIALEWKEISYEHVELSLRRQGGLSNIAGFKELSPTSQVPVLHDGDFCLSQSHAILEYLEEKFPQPPMLPQDMQARARVREFCQLVACDIHPLGTLRVRKYLSIRMGIDHKAKAQWQRHWLKEGLAILAERVDSSGNFCFGDAFSMADLFLIPKLYNARRMEIDLDLYPRLLEIEEQCLVLPAFIAAHPDRQEHN